MLLNRRSGTRQRTSGLASGDDAAVGDAGFGDRAARLVWQKKILSLLEGVMASFAELVFDAPSSIRVPTWERV